MSNFTDTKTSQVSELHKIYDEYFDSDKDGFFEGRVVTTAPQNQQYDYKVTIVDPQLMPFPEEVLSAAYSTPEATPLKVSSGSVSLELRVPFN